MSPAALVIGEALIDIVRRPDGQVAALPGGSPMNVAIGLARLGHQSHLATFIGEDSHGDAIVAHLDDSGVHLVPGSRSADHTPTAEATIATGGSASYVFDLAWELTASPLPAADVWHTGSIAAVLAPGAADVVAAIATARDKALISYDPNIRPDLMGTPGATRPKVEELVALADIVKASDEDLDWLYPGIDPLAVAAEWQGKGPRLVIVTRGADGVLAVGGDGRAIEAPARPADVVDTVGAGDSFMAGVLDALWRAGVVGAAGRERVAQLDADDLRGVLDWAGRIAAITVSRAGANPPWARELL